MSKEKSSSERLLEALLLCLGQHAVGEALGVRRRQLRQIQTAQQAVDTHVWRRPDRQMEVGPVEVHRHLQELR